MVAEKIKVKFWGSPFATEYVVTHSDFVMNILLRWWPCRLDESDL